MKVVKKFLKSGRDVKQVEMKQSHDISGEVEDEKNVDVISRLIYYGVETLCL